MTIAFGTINVSATTLWTEPGIKRDYDELILDSKVNPAAWAGGMDTEMRLWLVGKVETQALYGDRVAILDEQGEWLKVAVIGQRSPKHDLGYPGWLPASHVIVNQSFLNQQLWLPEAVISAPAASLYTESLLICPDIHLSFQTRLPVIEEQPECAAVLLPDGQRAFLRYTDFVKSSSLSFSAASIVEQARRFTGLRYLWGGITSFGYDCSGYSYSLYLSQGIRIPRDANDQAAEGAVVDPTDLKPGDLLFFSSDGTESGIHHVAMFTGDGRMIHAPNSRSAVREEHWDNGVYSEEFWGARRYSASIP